MGDVRVNLVNAAGEIENFAPEDAALVVQSGEYRPASEVDIAQAREKSQYGEGLANEAQTFAESAVGMATLGLSDVAAKALAPEYALGLVKRREYNESADAAGKVVGALGSLLGPGGVGVLGGAARAVTAPVRLATGLGTRAAELAAAKLAPTAARGILGRAAATGLELGAAGSVEGALTGAALQASQDYLLDHELTAERIVVGGGGMGAVLGGSLGGALGVAGGAIAGAAKAASQRFGKAFSADDATRAATRDLDDVALRADEARRAPGATAEADAKISQQLEFRSDDDVLLDLDVSDVDPVRREVVDQVRAMAKESNAREAIDGMIDAATPKIRERLDAAMQLKDDISPYVAVRNKPGAFEALIEAAPPSDMTAFTTRSRSLADDISARLKPHIDTTSQVYTPQGYNALKRAAKATDDFKTRLFDLETQADLSTPAGLAKAAEAADQYKRAMGKVRERVGDGNAAELLTDVYRGLIEPLEDAALLGEGVAGMQRAINGSYTRWFDSVDRFNSQLASAQSITRSEVDGFRKVQMSDPAKIKSTLRGMGRPENALNEETILLGLERQTDLMETLAKHYDVPEAFHARVSSMRADKAKIVEEMRRVKATVALADRYQEGLDRLSRIPFVGGFAAKASAAVHRGASVASDIEASAASGASAAETAALRASQTGAQKVGAAVSGILRWTGAAAQAAAGASVRTARMAADSAPVMGVALKLRDAATTESAIARMGVMADPNSDERSMARSRLAPLRRDNPLLADAIEAHTQRVSSFLLEKAGQLSAVPRPGDPFGGHRKPRQSPAKAAKLARYYDAAMNPQHALDRLSSGQLYREDLEALQALYPRIYQRVVDGVMMDLGRVGKLPSYSDRLRLGNVLNAPVDPSQRPENLMWLQDVAASQAGPKAEQAASGRVTGKMAKQSKLATQARPSTDATMEGP